MKKVLFLLLVVGAIVIGMGATSTQRMDTWRSLDTLTDVNASPDTDLAAATGFFPDNLTADIDLLTTFGGGRDTWAKYVQLSLWAGTAANGDTITQHIYGWVAGGPPQHIGQFVWKIGLAQYNATATNLWAETCTVTSDHASTITVAGDDGDDMPGSVTFDATGFRYLKSYLTADSGDPQAVTCLIRPLN